MKSEAMMGSLWTLLLCAGIVSAVSFQSHMQKKEMVFEDLGPTSPIVQTAPLVAWTQGTDGLWYSPSNPDGVVMMGVSSTAYITSSLAVFDEEAK